MSGQQRFAGMPEDPAGPPPVRVLSVRQPWASAIIWGGKDIENREWATRYRGLLLIHVAQRVDDGDWAGMLGGDAYQAVIDSRPDELRGYVIGAVSVDDCVRLQGDESRWADPGCWHWRLSGAVPLIRPVYARGLPGLWPAPREVMTEVYATAAVSLGEQAGLPPLTDWQAEVLRQVMSLREPVSG